jgi:uncharacterized membrane protein
MHAQLGDQIVMKPKRLRMIAWCIVSFAILLAACAVCFESLIAPVESGVNLLVLIIVLSNVMQATLLFMWADILSGRTDRNQ